MGRLKPLELVPDPPTVEDWERVRNFLARATRSPAAHRAKYEDLESFDRVVTLLNGYAKGGGPLEWHREEAECVHLFLDDRNAPRHDDAGNKFSIVGRVQQFLARESSTNKKLHRRIQAADSAATDSYEKAKRSGGSFARSLLRWAVTKSEQENVQLRAEIERLKRGAAGT